MSFCILSADELDTWHASGIRPVCRDHRHIRKAEALQMCHYGDWSPYQQPIARLVGPHHIRMTGTWTWRPTPTREGWPIGGPQLKTMQLVSGT